MSSPVRSDLPETGGRRREYAVGDMARLCRFPEQWTTRTVIRKLRALAELDDMPLPETPRIVANVKESGAASIHIHSRWDAGAVDAWLAGNRPGGPAAAPAPLPLHIRDELARRAASIAGTVSGAA